MVKVRIITLSTLLVGGLLCMPFFVSAQTPPTAAEQAAIAADLASSTSAIEKAAAKAIQDAKDSQASLNKLVEERTKQILSPEEIEKKTISDYLDVKINPKNPGPNETVTITIESYLSDLQKANISWSLNGKLIGKGMGKTVFIFQNGPSGKTTVASVSFTTNTGVAITKSFTFAPVGVTILWEANTYTPPFYKGKALMVPQARVRVVAVPDTVGAKGLSTGNLVYTWQQDGSVDSENSGYGRNSYSFTGPIPLSTKDVRVSVSSIDDSISSEMRINIPLVRPFILFYEKNPLLGILYNKPLADEFTLSKKEFSISAEPYFFSNEESEEATNKYDWTVNGGIVQNYGREITLRNDTGEKGDSVISLAMRGINRTFQNASQSLRMHFGNDSYSSLPTF